MTLMLIQMQIGQYNVTRGHTGNYMSGANMRVAKFSINGAYQ